MFTILTMYDIIGVQSQKGEKTMSERILVKLTYPGMEPEEYNVRKLSANAIFDAIQDGCTVYPYLSSTKRYALINTLTREVFYTAEKTLDEAKQSACDVMGGLFDQWKEVNENE